MDRREFLRLSFGALVASKLPALPAAAPDDIVWAATGAIQPMYAVVYDVQTGMVYEMLHYWDEAVHDLITKGVVDP